MKTRLTEEKGKILNEKKKGQEEGKIRLKGEQKNLRFEIQK